MEKTTHQERAYWAEREAAEADARHNAEVMNEIFTTEQALALLAAMRACPEAAAYMVEAIFETYGWPANSADINECWLDTAGSYTMQILKIYETGEVK